MFQISIYLFLTCFLAIPTAFSAVSNHSGENGLKKLNAVTQHGLLLAKNKKKKRSRSKTARKRYISGEKRVGKGSTQIDFEKANISGARKAPPGVSVTENKKEHGFDLIKMRLDWKDEMKSSTANIQTGRGR
tara:strand:+ start:302 stop:697 length:396 start_codon:yes stop_codon:yes gene_type:complete